MTACIDDLRSRLGADAVRDRMIDRLAWANDASHYLLVPSAVVTPADRFEVARLLAACTAAGTTLTFRSGGTSLSGQGVTDGVLADVRRHFRGIEVLGGGTRVRVGPGATIRAVNARLAGHGYKLGPDPASESAATVGGVIANNSSGMACGTALNAYRTLESVVAVLPSGTVVDTSAPDADRLLHAAEPALTAGLLRLRDRVRDDPASVALIERQFSMKNTMGYGLNSFLDHDGPAALLAHLLVGSEGTLAFVAEAVLATVPVPTHALTGLLVFPDLDRATAALPALVGTGAATIELLDAVSLRVGQRDAPPADLLGRLDIDAHTALLVEYQESSAAELDERGRLAAAVGADLPVVEPVSLSSDAAGRARLWQMRKGLYAAVNGARPPGTAALLEDIVVPVPALLPTCRALTELFDKHDYDDSVIFGHAKDGNLHFMLVERFGGDMDRYLAFTEDMVTLVLDQGGNLKAEHGTGRMMAPFVRRQYGDELYDVMRELKTLFDPAGVLNPGVIISTDELAHVHHLKSAPAVEEEVDRCVECGFCEPVCPSKDLTTTPRQRIVLRRAAERARADGDTATLRELERDEGYDVVDTCAVDGMCQTACPVHINTGDLVRRLRAERTGPVTDRAWTAASRHWGGFTRVAAAGLTAAGAVSPRIPETLSRLGNRVAGLPRWTADLPRGGSPRSGPREAAPEAVLFASCVGTMFGGDGDGAGPALTALAQRAGVPLTSPDGLDALCCGTPWKSKGLTAAAGVRDRVLAALWAATDSGRLPVVCDASSCTEGLVDAAGDRMRVLDGVQFVAEVLLPRLTVHRRIGRLALHPTCSSTRLGIDAHLRTVAGAVAEEVVVPFDWSCCGFAGDRGLLHPELTESATRAQAVEIVAGTFDAHASCNRTCEIGMSRATGATYRHVLELLERATRQDGGS